MANITGTMGIGSASGRSFEMPDPRDVRRQNPNDPNATEADIVRQNPNVPGADAKIYGLVPARDNVIVRQIELPRPMSAGGIHIPIKASDKFPKMGLVLFCGPGAFVHETGKYLPMSCKAGDRIIFDRLAGHDVCVNGEMLLVINDESVVAVVAEEKTLLDLPDLGRCRKTVPGTDGLPCLKVMGHRDGGCSAFPPCGNFEGIGKGLAWCANCERSHKDHLAADDLDAAKRK